MMCDLWAYRLYNFYWDGFYKSEKDRVIETHVRCFDLHATINLKYLRDQTMKTLFDGGVFSDATTFQRGFIQCTKHDASFPFFHVSVGVKMSVLFVVFNLVFRCSCFSAVNRFFGIFR
eukprot:TRINITY_DN30372_c0_g1_i1.p1 TRINITY_DN30372_c0_g1~~TRINITY_DN30372_c0_g1_i1.p1  ORF type:complete len:118 (+),score=8.76 TRINITY_DN30372_c0_g1_i1:394-747(+)